MIWTGTRTHERFSYVKTMWPALTEASKYGNITSGQIDRSFFSTTKETCKFDFLGGEEPDTVNAVRIYYSFKDETGEETSEALGTFLVSYADVQYTNTTSGTIAAGTVDGSSMLSVLADAVPGYAYTVAPGTKTVQLAKEIAESFSLQVSADESDHTISAAHTFEAGDNWLTILNWLLAQAGFVSAGIDAYGKIQMRKDTKATGASWEFKPGKESIIYPQVKESNNYMEAANVARVYYESETEAIRAWAKLKLGSKSSLEERGNRERSMFEEVTEVAGETLEAKAAELEAYALKILQDNSNEITKLEWRHPYVPITCGDAVRVVYGKQYDLTLTNMSISLRPATETTSNGRSIAQNDLTITTESEVLWNV